MCRRKLPVVLVVDVDVGVDVGVVLVVLARGRTGQSNGRGCRLFPLVVPSWHVAP
jgi:hypothetical protein